MSSLNDHLDPVYEFEDGFKVYTRTEADEDMGPPWKEHDGHGPVTDWVYRDKKPGEWTLIQDGKSYRFYDAESALIIAKRDGWGLGIDDLNRLWAKLGRCPTRKELCADAVRLDFERLRGWCNDQWHWIGVITELRDAEGDLVDDTSLWGVESDGDYHKDVAAEQIAELIKSHEFDIAEDHSFACRC